LLAALGVLGYFYAKREFNEALRAYTRRTNAKLKKFTAEIDTLNQQLQFVSASVSKKQTDGTTANVNPFLKMEDRFEKDLKKQVKVNGEAVPFAKVG